MGTNFSIERDPDGIYSLLRPMLGPTGGELGNPAFGGLTIIPSVGARGFLLNQRFSLSFPPNADGDYLGDIRHGYLQRLEAVNIATGVTGGHFLLLNASGGDNIYVLRTPRSNPGDRYVWEFPTPPATQQPSNPTNFIQGVFAIGTVDEGGVGTGSGVWFFTCNGYFTRQNRNINTDYNQQRG
jgi:hypothetical protein